MSIHYSPRKEENLRTGRWLASCDLNPFYVQGKVLETATFGAGCFWGPELMFARVPGVVSTKVGYSQGSAASPSYEDVCSGLTGHNEVVQVCVAATAGMYNSLI